jgi:hypothetical protein
LDNRSSLGNILDGIKSISLGRRTNVDTLDIAKIARGSAHESVLEGINTTGICLHADIRCMAVVGNVKLEISD